MVCFVVLHYLVAEETINCVNSLLTNIAGNIKIIIVDNASPNDSYDTLFQVYNNNSHVVVIKNQKNGGYSDGINVGYQYAKKNLNPDFIISMNNDMEIKQSDFISKIYSIFERTGFYVMGPDIYSTTAFKHQNPERTTISNINDIDKQILQIEALKKQRIKLHVKSFLRRFSLINKIYYTFKRLKKNNYVDNELVNVALHGSFYVFSKLFINKRDLALTPLTSFYCEAQILDYECKRDDLKQIYSPELVVFHHEDVATNAVTGSYAAKMDQKYQRVIIALKEFRKEIDSDQRRIDLK